MGKIFCVGTILVLSAALFQCSSAGYMYRSYMFEGKHLLGDGDYKEAEQDFVKATQVAPDARSYAFAATASYKLKDYPEAERFIQEAEKRGSRSYAYLRIVGYRALILLAEGKQQEGLDALHVYLEAYARVYPLSTIDDVERMWRRGKVDLPRLEALLDHQITTYEDELEQYWTAGTGYYGNRSGATAVGGIR